MLPIVVCLLLALAGCAEPGRGPAIKGPLTIFASTSLTEVMQSLSTGFETSYPQVKVAVTLASDSELARRSAAGPAPDLIAAEGTAPLAAAGPTGPVVHFASNQLVIVAAADNPKGLFGLADLVRPDVRLALCAGTEPCGTAAATVLASAQLAVPATATRVGDVRAALAKVADGTADAALVYRSDARLAGGDLATIEFPESRTALVQYQAAVPTGAANPAAGNAFLDYLAAPGTLDAITNGGFQPPS